MAQLTGPMNYSNQDISSQYYLSLLAEKDKEISKLWGLLENQKRDEKVARTILDNPKITHSATKSRCMRSRLSGIRSSEDLQHSRAYSIEDQSPIPHSRAGHSVDL